MQMSASLSVHGPRALAMHSWLLSCIGSMMTGNLVHHFSLQFTGHLLNMLRGAAY
jgi:hypothetical protein